MCQAYDQQVEKDYKMHMRAALNMLNPVIGRIMDQWYLISISINNQNCIKKDSCIDSLKKFNMHPHARSTLDVWIRKIDDCGFPSAKKLSVKSNNLYVAMPECWKKLDVEQR